MVYGASCDTASHASKSGRRPASSARVSSMVRLLRAGNRTRSASFPNATIDAAMQHGACVADARTCIASQHAPADVPARRLAPDCNGIDMHGHRVDPASPRHHGRSRRGRARRVFAGRRIARLRRGIGCKLDTPIARLSARGRGDEVDRRTRKSNQSRRST